MDIKELAASIYDDLDIVVSSITRDTDVLQFGLEYDDWAKSGAKLAFRFRCEGVKESNLVPGQFEGIWWEDEHPLLLRHNYPRCELYFATPPDRPSEVVGMLFLAHESYCNGWLRFYDFLNSGLGHGRTDEVLAMGFGLLAGGPLPLMELYRQTVGHLLETYIVVSSTAIDRRRLLLVDSQFVICTMVRVEQLAG